MFNPKKIQSKIEALSTRLIQRSPFDAQGRPVFKPGFLLTPHSINQIEQANSVLEATKKSGKAYSTEEYRWIRNERALCSVDFLYWASRYGFIIDWEGKLARFNPNLPQRILLKLMSDMEAEDMAILIMVLKARQEGVTTLSELIMLWRTIFTPYANTLVASSRPDKSEQMVEKMELCLANQPDWLIPTVGTYNKGELIGFDSMHSAIHIRHGAQMSGLGRGSTMTSFHLAEVTEFLHADKLIDASLIRAVHDSPWLLGLMETTGAGRHGWFYDKWNYSVENWPTRTSRLCPAFLPWFLMRDLYPTKTWLKTHPINWQGPVPEIVLAHARNAEKYVQGGQNPLVTEILGSGWSMPEAQMWYWWVERKEYVAGGKLNLFLQEMCANENEAFQSPNTTIFSPEITDELRQFAKPPVGVYGILAPQSEVPSQFQATERDIDYSQPYIDIRANWSPTAAAQTYRLVPLLHRGAAPFSPMGKVVMYERPEPGEIYLAGTDTGFGLGKDRSVINVLRKGSATRDDEQVCEFASPQLNSFTLWPFNLALGTLYSTVVGGKLRQCRQVIEGAANGENVYNELKKRGWREFHNWLRYNKKMALEYKANIQLWMTNSWSRPLMLDMLFDAVNNGWLQINSPWFVDELSGLELYEEKQKIAAAYGEHDDRIMSLGIALFSAHATETRGREGWQARQRQRGDDHNPTYMTYSPGSQGSVEPEDSPQSSYNYRVITGDDPDAEYLSASGSGLWTPND